MEQWETARQSFLKISKMQLIHSAALAFAGVIFGLIFVLKIVKLDPYIVVATAASFLPILVHTTFRFFQAKIDPSRVEKIRAAQSEQEFKLLLYGPWYYRLVFLAVGGLCAAGVVLGK
jgi:hypothetical protein